MADFEALQLEKSYPSPSGDVSVLHNASLSLNRGDAAVITGPSGVGKSTLLYLIGLLEPPDGGTLQFLDAKPFELNAVEQARFRNERIGFVFQDHHLLPQCNVLENVVLPKLARGSVTKGDQQRALELLERVGLQARADHRPAQLSGGERQRAALCRALIMEPDVVLADEPTGNLDTHTADRVGELLLSLAKDTNVMLLCVTHSLGLAKRFPTHYELRDGSLVQSHTETMDTRKVSTH